MSKAIHEPVATRTSPGPTAVNLLEVSNLTKMFPLRSGLFGRARAVVHAVDDISFTVRQRETLGIVGESGCGKSTTARLLMQLIAPDSGSIVFNGRSVSGPDGLSRRELRRNMQMVFQDSYSSFNPRLTAQETIAFAPMVHGMAKREAHRQAQELLMQVGLDPLRFARCYPHELSGGQGQRVNIARALALQPRLVILDEPVSALDKSIEAQVLNLLIDLKNKLDLTYIFISHDLHVIRYIADRVVVMYLGKIVEVGPVDEIYGAPKHPYTQALLSSVPTMDPDRRADTAPLAGDPPNPIDPPRGCRFHTRCRFAEDVCARQEPVLLDDGLRGIACHLWDGSSGHSRAGHFAQQDRFCQVDTDHGGKSTWTRW